MEASEKRYRSLIQPWATIGIVIGCISLYASDNTPGFICVPVAELTGMRLQDNDPEAVYITWNPDKHNRLHQALFFEPVIILEQQDQESLIQFPLAQYIQGNSLKPCIAWTLNKNIIAISNTMDTSRLPSFFDITSYQNNTIALTQPFFDTKRQQLFSAGTRFAVKKKNMRTFLVHAFDVTQKQWYVLKIPHKKCIEIKKNQKKNEQKNDFILLLRSWAHNSCGYIPYVLGGCSVCTFDANPFFNFQKNKFPLRGIDCTGLILRAAQICNIPYFFKNSATLHRYATPISEDEPIELGDIFWIKGHAFIVSNLDEPSFIEARGYTPHKFGRIHEITLPKVFQGITSFEQLRQMYKEGKSIARLDKDGIPHDTHKEFRFFKIF